MIAQPHRVLAVDPGLERSGWVIFDGRQVLASGIAENGDMLKHIITSSTDHLAIEMVASYGMPVGYDVFETVWWIGRFTQAWRAPERVRRIYRRDVKLELCGTPRARDPHVRQALIDRLGKPGTKKQRGPTYGVTGDMWAALGVAVVATLPDATMGNAA